MQAWVFEARKEQDSRSSPEGVNTIRSNSIVAADIWHYNGEMMGSIIKYVKAK